MPTVSAPTFSRRIRTLLASRIAEGPAVAVHGARTVGKSTTVRSLASSAERTVVDLDDPETRDAVAANPSTFAAAERTAQATADTFGDNDNIIGVLIGDRNGIGDESCSGIEQVAVQIHDVDAAARQNDEFFIAIW